MATAKTYSLEYLQSIQAEITEDTLPKINKSFNSLLALFPLNTPKELNIAQPWAFRCLCGNYVIKPYYAVANSDRNRSCGCYKARKGCYQGIFRTFKEAIPTKYKILSVGFNYKSRDWGFECKDCGGITDKGAPYEHLVLGREFCKCSGKYKGTYDEAKDNVREAVASTNWSIVGFPEEFTFKKHLRVDLHCNKCGYETDMLYTNIVRSDGCKGCKGCACIATGEARQKDLAWFIEGANRKHNYKYDYSQAVYTKAREPLTIICHEHKEPVPFRQSPDNHKNKGQGCPECKRLRLRYVAFALSCVLKNKDVYKNLPSGVYIGVLEDGLYKIGLTCKQDKRFKEIKNSSGFDIKLIKYVEMNLFEAFMFEHFLHKKYEECNYTFKDYWDGHSECFTLNAQQLKELTALLDKGYEEFMSDV